MKKKYEDAMNLTPKKLGYLLLKQSTLKDPEYVNFILSIGAEEVADTNGHTAIYNAAKFNLLPSLKMLIDAFGLKNDRDSGPTVSTIAHG